MSAPEIHMQLKHQIAELRQAMECGGIHPETLCKMRIELDQKLCALRGVMASEMGQ